GDGAVLVEDRLAAVGQADDAGAAAGVGQAGAFGGTVLVGAAVDDGPGHGADRPRRPGTPFPRPVVDPRDAAPAPPPPVPCPFTPRAGLPFRETRSPSIPGRTAVSLCVPGASSPAAGRSG